MGTEPVGTPDSLLDAMETPPPRKPRRRAAPEQTGPVDSRMERVTPQSLEAERALLGACLIDATAVAYAVQHVKAEDFYREINRRVFRVILTLFARGEEVSLFTVAEELRRLLQLNDMGGTAYLSALIESCDSAQRVKVYADVVLEKSELRAMLEACSSITDSVYGEVENMAELRDAAQKRILDATTRNSTQSFYRIDQLLRQRNHEYARRILNPNEAPGVPSGFPDLDEALGGWQQSDLIILAARPSMGKCLAPWVLIDDPATGARKTVQQFVKDKSPVIHGIGADGKIRVTKVGDWIDNGIKPVFRVTTKLGRTVDVTEHHPFLTVNGWTKLSDIGVGGAVALPRAVDAFGEDESMSLDRVRIMSYLIAEGNLASTPRFTNTDPVLVTDFCESVAREYPMLKANYDGRFTYSMSNIRKGQDNPLTDWLRRLGLWGKLATQKTFPPCVWTWSKRYLAEFMRVLFSCDGTIYALGPSPRMEFTVASEGLAKDVHHALTRFGIISKLHYKPASYRGKDGVRIHKHSWRVEITDPSAVAIYQREIGWVGEKQGRFPVESIRREPKRTSNFGHCPKEVWGMVKAAAKDKGISMIELARRAGETTSVGHDAGWNPHSNRALPSYRLRAYAEVLDNNELRAIASPDLYWDKIVSIEPLGEHRVYDLTVPDGANFIAQDICVHNSAAAAQFALNAARATSQPSVFFSLEMDRDQLTDRYICSEGRIDSKRLQRNYLSHADLRTIDEVSQELSAWPLIIDDTPGASVLEMRAKARQIASQYGPLGLVVVDYLQLARAGQQRRGGFGNSSRQEEVAEIAKGLKNLARELHCPVIALSQLSRAVEARDDKRPMLSDLRESGSIEAEADIVLFVYREAYYARKQAMRAGETMPGGYGETEEAEIIIGKQRKGATGMVKLGFQPQFTSFVNLEQQYGSYESD